MTKNVVSNWHRKDNLGRYVDVPKFEFSRDTRVTNPVLTKSVIRSWLFTNNQDLAFMWPCMSNATWLENIWIRHDHIFLSLKISPNEIPHTRTVSSEEKESPAKSEPKVVEVWGNMMFHLTVYHINLNLQKWALRKNTISFQIRGLILYASLKLLTKAGGEIIQSCFIIKPTIWKAKHRAICCSNYMLGANAISAASINIDPLTECALQTH